MNNLETSTKAKTLKFLEKYQKNLNFKIPESFYFTLSDYKKKQHKILDKIIKKFRNEKLIIRSSSIDEDNIDNSSAGKYNSYQNVRCEIKELRKYINLVIEKFKNRKDQVLVQEYIENVDISGVVFTRNLNNNGPYYYINYDNSGKTNLVTGGSFFEDTKCLVVSRYKFKKSNKFKKLLLICNKFERIFKNDRLEIKFCIKKNKIIIFQCRPLSKKREINDNLIQDMLVNIEKKIKKIKLNSPFLEGNTTFLSNMADWNPAEMIGSKAKPLSLSLYSELITNDIWSKQRENYNYKNVNDHPLLFNLGGSPYVDLRLDLNSFLPSNISQKIQKKVINYCLNKIKKNPNLHDKIEFELIETCFDFDSIDKIKKILNQKDAKVYAYELKKLTENIICNNIIKLEEKKISYLSKKINIIQNSKMSEIQKIHFFVQICKKYGTLPFAGAARCAFISTKMLRTLVKFKVLNEFDVEDFYSSIKSVTTEMNNFLFKSRKNKKYERAFFDHFGHLRPSTYSISSLNYKENFKNYFPKDIKVKYKKQKKFYLNKKQEKKINSILRKQNLKFNCEQLINFSVKSIYCRENFKLIFTKCINQIFENLISLGNELKIKKNDFDYISINTILNSYNNLDLNKLKKIIKSEISENKKKFNCVNLIDLPDVILNSSDIYEFEKKNSTPNYITEKSVTAKSIIFKEIKKNKNLRGKIIILESADPGFDFIFSYGIKGLITKYGGANSHMSIRCLEQGIPAIIGIGENRYKDLSRAKIININSYEKNYKIIN